METPRVTQVLDKSYELARGLGVSGTPTYIIGDEIIPGAIGLEGLRQRIASMRECGRTDCTAVTPAASPSAVAPITGENS